MHRGLQLAATAAWLSLSACASASSAGPGAGQASVPPAPPPILIRRSPIPPPTTLAALLEIYRGMPDGVSLPRELARCPLPGVVPGADWITLDGPDAGFRLRLPAGFRVRLPADTIFGQPQTTLEDGAGGRIRVRRILTGAEGRETLRTGESVELPHTGPCQMGEGPAGSIWTLYPPAPAATSGLAARHVGLGDLITAGGGRYKISVGAPTAEMRDRLVRIVSAAAQADAVTSVPGGA